MSVNVIGQTLVIINDSQIAVEILDRTGSTFADRPPLPMATLCGWDRVLSSARYGPRYLDWFWFRFSDQTRVFDVKILEIPQTNRSCSWNTQEYGQVPTYGGLSGHHVLEACFRFSQSVGPGTSDIMSMPQWRLISSAGDQEVSVTTMFLALQLAWSTSFVGPRGHWSLIWLTATRSRKKAVTHLSTWQIRSNWLGLFFFRVNFTFSVRSLGTCRILYRHHHWCIPRRPLTLA